MRKLAAILVALASLSGCRGNGVAGYWEKNGIDYSDYDAAQDRMAIFAEKAVVANQQDAFEEIDVLFNLLKEDEVAYYIYTDWIDASFYNPLSPCRNAGLYGKAVERILSDGVFSERETEPFRRHLEWIQFNRTGEDAVVPEVALDGRRTLVLVLDLGCPTCRESLAALAGDPEWADVRRIAIGFGYGPVPDVPGWEYRTPDSADVFFDPQITPAYYVVSPDGKVESTYKLL